MNQIVRQVIFCTAGGLLAVFSYGQETKFKALDSLVEGRQTSQASEILASIDPDFLNEHQQARYHYYSGMVADLSNKTDRSVEQWLRAKRLYLQLDSLERVAHLNLKLAQTLNSLQEPDLSPDPFIQEYLSYSKEKDDPALLSAAYMQLGKIYINSDPSRTIDYFNKALEENSKTQNSLMKAKIHHNLGVLYGEHSADRKAAFYHYGIALKEYERRNLQDFIFYIHNNTASLYKNLKKYDSAIFWYRKADSLSVKEYSKGNKQFLYKNMAETFKLKKDFRNALKYLELQNVYRDSIKQDEQNKALIAVQTKYEVEKKEKENLQLKQDQLWLISGVVFLLLVVIIIYLLYLDQKNKKRLAGKAAEMERERLEKVLKQQELAGIDAMIEGQEKERQRIANDLHDNLGSLLATIKLHFQNLKVRKDRMKAEEDQIMQQTNDLLDEAYQQVRNMAHLKNSGLKAQEGLVPALKNFASKVSASNALVIEVEDHGMEKRLDNSIEIILFRIVQELITNVIKHADASEAFVHLTHHGDSINLMVEDNGKGFKVADTNTDAGMGLTSLQKRLEHMDGKFEIESIPGKGTTIIIDIPVA